jgi:hypothetical protein
MKIEGPVMKSPEQVAFEIQQGAKFVVFEYCFSIIVLSFRRSSGFFYVRPDENALGKGWKYTLLSLFFGWWGIPWGPIWTVASIARNLRGGRDVTHELVDAAGPDGIEIVPAGCP